MVTHPAYFMTGSRPISDRFGLDLRSSYSPCRRHFSASLLPWLLFPCAFRNRTLELLIHLKSQLVLKNLAILHSVHKSLSSGFGLTVAIPVSFINRPDHKLCWPQGNIQSFPSHCALLIFDNVI